MFSCSYPPELIHKVMLQVSTTVVMPIDIVYVVVVVMPLNRKLALSPEFN